MSHRRRGAPVRFHTPRRYICCSSAGTRGSQRLLRGRQRISLRKIRRGRRIQPKPNPLWNRKTVFRFARYRCALRRALPNTVRHTLRRIFRRIFPHTLRCALPYILRPPRRPRPRCGQLPVQLVNLSLFLPVQHGQHDDRGQLCKRQHQI